MKTSAVIKQAGFTLIEVSVAVAVLGLALVTLIGLQTRTIDTYFNEARRIKASFVAQYIMTMIEINPEVPELGTKQGSLIDLLRDLDYFSLKNTRHRRSEFDGWEYMQSVNTIEGIPLLEGILREVNLEISWGPGSNQTYSLLYFINDPEAVAKIKAQL